MISARALAYGVILAGVFGCSVPAQAEIRASERHEAWSACLSDAFGLRASLSSRALAAETAIRECRDSEAAYLSALSTSPLLDEDDIGRARPALLARAKTWLLSGRPSRSL